MNVNIMCHSIMKSPPDPTNTGSAQRFLVRYPGAEIDYAHVDKSLFATTRAGNAIVFTPHTFDKKDAGAITCAPASFYCSDLSGRVPTPQPFGAGAFTTISSRTASSRFHTFIFV